MYTLPVAGFLTRTYSNAGFTQRARLLGKVLHTPHGGCLDVCTYSSWFQRKD
jgi:hypothetical protein